MQKVAVNARVRLPAVAALAVYFTQVGHKPRNRSHLIHLCVEALHGTLVQQDLIEPIFTQEQAVETLRTLGIEWDPNTDSGESLASAIHLESINLDALRKIEGEKTDKFEREELMEAARKMLTRIEEEEGDS